MSERKVERRLAAILGGRCRGLLAADGCGRGRHARAAEGAAPRELIDPKIKEHRGRIVKTTGDGLLVEFASVVDAVRCAVEVQRGMAERNADRAGGAADRVPHRHQSRRHHQRTATSSATASTSPPASKRLAEPGGICVSRRGARPGARQARFRLRRSWASSRSRTSPGRCASIECCR